MKIYNDPGTAYHYLEKDSVDEEQRNIILKYIFTSPSYSFEALRDDLLKNDEEIQKAIEVCLCSDDGSLSLLKYQFNKLNEEQIQLIIKRLLKTWNYSYVLLHSFKHLLTQEQINQAFDMIILNENTLVKSLSTNMLTKEQRLFILDNLSHIRSVCLTILEIYGDEIDEREIAFNSVINSRHDLYKLAKKNKLNYSEKEKLYKIYHKFYYDNNKYKTSDYCDYCRIFQEFLSEHEHKLLIKKAARDNSLKVSNKILADIKLPEKYKDKLQGIIIAQKLARGY